MRARYEHRDRERLNRFSDPINLLDRVRDKDFKAKQRWLRCRMHWFGDPEFRRDEMEKELKRVLVESQRVTDEYRKPGYEQQRYTGEYHVPLYQLGMDEHANQAFADQEITAQYEAAADSVAAFRQPIILPTESTPIAGFLETYPDRDINATPHQFENSQSAKPTQKGDRATDLGSIPETSVLFEPYYPQHGVTGRKTTAEVNLFGTYTSKFSADELAIEPPSIKRSAEVAKPTKPEAPFDAGVESANSTANAVNAQQSDFTPAILDAIGAPAAQTAPSTGFATPATTTETPSTQA